MLVFLDLNNKKKEITNEEIFKLDLKIANGNEKE